MKILVVSPVGTRPMRSGAAQAVQGYCTALQALGHEVHLAYHPIMGGDTEAMRADWGDRLHVIPYSHPAVNGTILAKAGYRLRQLAKRWLLSRHNPQRYNYRLDEWYDESLGPEILALQHRHRFNAVFVNYVFLSKVFTVLAGEPLTKVLVTHDRFADRNFRVAGTNTASMWFSCSLAEEAKGLERADRILALQESEGESLQAATTKPVSTVNPQAPVRALPCPAAAARSLLFIGSDIAINRDGITQFIHGVLPVLRSKYPDIELKIAGRVCRLIEAQQPGVSKLGEVESLDDAYGVAAMAINPVNTGTGLCIKSLEALSYGRPLVSTPAGARGLEAAVNHGLLLAETADQYVTQIGKLVESPAYRELQSQAALEFVRKWNEAVSHRLRLILH